MEIERVETAPGVVPEGYHCRCRFCQKSIGELVRADGTNYSRLDRRKYYDPIERGSGGHIAKTPLHVARGAIQEYSRPGGWVLDPTAGSGTTLVESLVQGRNAAGMELQYEEVISANVRRHAVGGLLARVRIGDSRGIGGFLSDMGEEFDLVVNNPPYFGDQSFPGPSVHGRGREHRATERKFLYDKDLPNLAFLKEGTEYWQTMADIYRQCTDYLIPGGRFVVGVKDQMRSKKPDYLHEKFAEVLEGIGLVHEGTAFLKHYPPTLHLSTYGGRYGVEPPKYQSIVVFRKGG